MIIPNPVYLFRIVHWQNIEYILRHGLCSNNHTLKDPQYINIGHPQLIADRDEYPVPLEGYGNLGEYIPFYFWGHSPMLYLIMHGYKGVTQYPQKDIVYLVIDSKQIIEADFQYVFTDRHAKVKLAKFFNQPDDLQLLRWDIIKSKRWDNTEEDFQRMDFKQAEFLVRDHIPTHFINRLIVKNDERRRDIEEIVRKLDLNIPVSNAPDGKLYY